MRHVFGLPGVSQVMEMSEFRSHEQIVADVLSRFSVTDLIEQTDADLSIGDERFYKAKAEMNVLAEGETGLIRWWKIQSGEHLYECRRFKQFCFCSCKSFFFSKRICKHLARTCRIYCAECFEVPARVGKLCHGCNDKRTAFLKPSRPQTLINTNSL